MLVGVILNIKKNVQLKPMLYIKLCWSKKELCLWHKLWFYNPYIFGIQCRKSLIFQTYIIWSNRIHSLKYRRSITTLESEDIGFRKAEFVAKIQFLSNIFICIYFLHKPWSERKEGAFFSFWSTFWKNINTFVTFVVAIVFFRSSCKSSHYYFKSPCQER